MQRNQTKKLILEVAEDFDSPVEAGLFQTWLEYQYNVCLSDRATKMALLRAMRQGLLHRRNGKYSLSEKGERRLVWLRSTMQ